MSHSRRGLMHRFTAIILVVAMPLCCCVLNVAAGVSCCDPAPQVEVISCCSGPACDSESTEPVHDELPCTGEDCQCCLKAPISIQNWTPPVDTIGTILMTAEMTPDGSLPSFKLTATLHGHHPPPQPEDSGPVRGPTIIQV